MKKITLVFASIVLFASAAIYTACDKANTVAPTIVLNGAATITHTLNATFHDPGATATDETGKALNVKITCAPVFNKDLVGTYVFTYSAVDIDGNLGELTRTVTVQNDAIGFEGTYDATDDHNSDGTIDDSWTETITASININNRIIFSKFAYYTDASPYADLYAGQTSINMPQQAFTCGTPAVDRLLSGTGIINTDPEKSITINLTEVTGIPPVTTTGIDVYTKQQEQE